MSKVITEKQCVRCGKSFYSNYDESKVCPSCLYKEMKEYKDKKISDLEAKLAESEERLKAIDNWKENYGYTNYEDIYMLEDLQSRAFQSEDDTTVVNELLDYLNISDENEILPTIQQQLAEKETRITELEDKDWYEATIEQLEEQNERLIKERDGNYENYSICWKENAQLKQQLDEWTDGTIICKWTDAENKVKELEQQLAEKEKEIISLECVISEIQNDIKELHEFKVGEDEYDLTDSDARFSLECELLNKDQDKISFCLERIKEIGEAVIDAFNKSFGELCLSAVKEIIDNQINLLKEGK